MQSRLQTDLYNKKRPFAAIEWNRLWIDRIRDVCVCVRVGVSNWILHTDFLFSGQWILNHCLCLYRSQVFITQYEIQALNTIKWMMGEFYFLPLKRYFIQPSTISIRCAQVWICKQQQLTTTLTKNKLFKDTHLHSKIYIHLPNTNTLHFRNENIHNDMPFTYDTTYRCKTNFGAKIEYTECGFDMCKKLYFCLVLTEYHIKCCHDDVPCSMFRETTIGNTHWFDLTCQKNHLFGWIFLWIEYSAIITITHWVPSFSN